MSTNLTTLTQLMQHSIGLLHVNHLYLVPCYIYIIHCRDITIIILSIAVMAKQENKEFKNPLKRKYKYRSKTGLSI